MHGPEGPPIDALLEPGLRARLAAAAQRRRFADGTTIHQRGDARPGLSIVRAGAVRIGNPGLDGAYVVSSVMGPGAVFGEATLFIDLPRTHEAVAVGPTEVDEIGRAAFFSLLDEAPALGRAMLRVVTARLYGALEYLDDLQRLPASVRIAKILIAAAKDGEVRISQSAIGERAGVSRVSVGKALSELKGLGLAAPGYRRIAVDEARLKRYVADRLAIAPLCAD